MSLVTTSVASGAARSKRWRTGAGDGALVNVVAGEEAARADLGPPRRRSSLTLAVVARVDVGEIEQEVSLAAL